MNRYLASSAGVHVTLLLLILFSPWFRSSRDVIMVEGFDFLGTGGGGDGTMGGGPKPQQMGQVVPQPVKVPVPAKPAPIQKQTVAEDAWKVKDAQEIKPVKEPPKQESNVEVGEKTQAETSNIIRRGVGPNTVAGDGYDFGGSGTGKGPGMGIGFGPGEGGGFGGFGGYLKALRQRIWSEWTQSAVIGSNQSCVVGLTVARNGEISNIKVEEPSGNSFYDSVALRAVRNSSPLPPLPSSFPKSEQRFRIKFRLLE